MKSRVKREMDKQLIYIASLLIIVGKTRPDYQTMVKSRSNCFIISGCCVITGTGSNMVRHFGHYEMLCNTPYLRPNRMLCNRFHGGRHLGTTGTTRLKTNALYYCDVPRSSFYGVYISQLYRFARASSYVTDYNTRNKFLTQKLLKQSYRYHKLHKTFPRCFGCLSDPPGFTCWISFAPVFSLFTAESLSLLYLLVIS